MSATEHYVPAQSTGDDSDCLNVAKPDHVSARGSHRRGVWTEPAFVENGNCKHAAGIDVSPVSFQLRGWIGQVIKRFVENYGVVTLFRHPRRRICNNVATTGCGIDSGVGRIGERVAKQGVTATNVENRTAGRNKAGKNFEAAGVWPNTKIAAPIHHGLHVAVLLLCAVIVHGAVLPTESQPPAGTWAAAGVPGGIPTGRTVHSILTSTGDATDRSAAIQAALNACPSGQSVRLSNGTYRVNSGFDIPNGVEIFGDGPTQTILDIRGGVYSGVNLNDGWPNPSSDNIVTSETTAGTTTFTIADTSGFTAGRMVRIEIEDQRDNTAVQAGAVPVIKTDDPPGYNRSQITRLVSKTGTTLTVSPGLYRTVDSGLEVRIKASAGEFAGVGIRDMQLDFSNGSVTFGVWFQSVRDSWIYNCRIIQPGNYGIFFMSVFRSTVKRNHVSSLGGGGSNGANLLFGSLGDGACAILVEDNIFEKCFPNIEVNFGSAGNVFAYNYCFDSSSSGGGNGGSIFSNHGPHNYFNLYEGNIAPSLENDGYFGSTSEDTVLRNHFTGVNPGVDDRGGMILKRFTRRYQVIGNLFLGDEDPYSEVGTPNIGNGSSTGTAQPTIGDFWADWPDEATVDGYQELDLDVAASSVFKGNYYDGSIISGESLGGDTIATSLYLSEKPSWFFDREWPPIVTTGTPNTNHNAIPAGYRFLNAGADPPSEGEPSTSNPRTIGGVFHATGNFRLQ